MTKLTRDQARLHQQAQQLVNLARPLNEEEKWFVLEHWHESGTATHTLNGAFFTPLDLARDMAFEVVDDRVIDLCAGIGRLAFAARQLIGGWNGPEPGRLVCVERDPEYVAVGRRVLPEATWICGSVFDLPADIGEFDTSISNPPFGRIARDGQGPRYRGPLMEYHVIDVAAGLARRGVFLIPQNSAPFSWSGLQQFTATPSAHYARFESETGIELRNSSGIDTSNYAQEWRGVSPATEIVITDFTERRQPAHSGADGGRVALF